MVPDLLIVFSFTDNTGMNFLARGALMRGDGSGPDTCDHPPQSFSVNEKGADFVMDLTKLKGFGCGQVRKLAEPSSAGLSRASCIQD